MNLPIRIAATIEAERLLATIENVSPQSLRIWSRDCSWGYSTFSLLVTRSGWLDDQQELIPKPIFWTVNYPRDVEIEPGGRTAVDFHPGAPQWVGLVALEPWKAEPWEVRVRFRIPDTAEAREHGVFIGEAVSSPAISDPPHNWLFDRQGRE